MLLTSQELAVRQWVVAAVADEPTLEAVPLDRVLWADQSFPAGAYPRCELAYTGDINLGADRPKSLGPADAMLTRTESETTLALTFVTKTSDTAPSRNQSATSYMREVNLRTHSFVAKVMTDAKLAIRDVNLTPAGNRMQGLSEWELRAGLDITFGNAATISEDPGIIETAEVTGTTTPPTPVRSYLISS